jgi:nucleotide-binding universal stress UspA family protein
MDHLHSIVVHVDGTDRAELRLRIAQVLAREAQARLTVLYAVTPMALALPPTVPEGAAVYAAALESLEADRRARARASFDRIATTAAPSERLLWEDGTGHPSEAITAARALTTDLLVLGQHDPSDSQTSLESDLAPTALVVSGAPAWIVPHAGHFAESVLAARDTVVLVAWKPTAEASRAVRAALPWLRRAREVHIAVGQLTDAAAHRPGAAAVRDWLQVQGVKGAIYDHGIGLADPGERLLSLAADLGADQLVMGCYGHSRAREFVLGGASRTVLRSMTLPVLMSH